ncbi:TonB-dependent receptor [Novosphingobium beihaiensis]|uniref:TonB-dependent receptor n=1 Tax=Novosphingobium beihaiensis TaxID=2930389 RepID=A0ABT0BW66_9SPHN|nr:TonB-dependent receptor [Novosphingobium beihaiensis]MCJ2189188.1 TonB-dependent receptor [Novosphingobium beihaiensis]
MKTSLRLAAGLLASASFATIAHAGDLSGNVSDATGTRALQSATVKIVELDRATRTDRDGSYIFADIPAGEYTVEVSYVGAIVETKKISIPETGRVQGNFALAGIGGGDILVVGQAANQASALSRKRAADGVEDVLTRDAVGEFPDQNVAESLRRLPGVNILNDQGEGRFVSVRGLAPNLNSTSLNGVRVPAPESDVREVALDVVSSDTIESIEVKKSLTPDMDADAIGASIEIKTTSAFDRKKDFYSVRAEGSYNDYNGQVTPKGSFDFSKRLGDNFGVAGSVSYYKRKFETDNVEADPWKLDDNDVPFSDTIEYRDYDVTRTRINAGLSFDWRASDTTKVYLRGNWSQFDDHEYRRRTTFDFGKFDEVSDASGDTVSFDDADDRIKVERDLKDRFERQRIRTVVLGGDTDTGTWTFKWLASYAKSSEEEHGSIDPVRFSHKFEDEGVVIDWDYSDRRVPTYSVSSGADLFNSPDTYTLDKVEITTLSDSRDREYALKADLGRTFATDSGDFTIQAGAKQRWRKKSYNKTQTDYGDNDDLTMADYLGEQTYRLHGISLGPVLDKQAGVNFMADHGGELELDEDGTLIDSISDDYSAKEDITAAYALARWDSDALRVIGGVRMERTHNELNGNLYNEDSLEITPRRFTRSYTDWLPSLTVRLAPENNIVMRAAAYKSLMRPNLKHLAPIFSNNEDNEAEFGNPELKPYKAWNFDFGVEWYFSGNGALTFGAFYKSVNDFIVKRYFAGDAAYSDITGVTYNTLETHENGDKADIAGFEVGYSQAYTMLPEPFDGLLTQVNYTYTYTKGTVYDEDDMPYRVALPDNSRHTFNVVLGYDKGPLDLRLAGSYRSKYLDELGDNQESDRWVDNHFQLDFSGKLKVMPGVKLTVDVININNAKYYAYQNFGGAQRLLQFEKYGPTYKFGVKASF